MERIFEFANKELAVSSPLVSTKTKAGQRVSNGFSDTHRTQIFGPFDSQRFLNLKVLLHVLVGLKGELHAIKTQFSGLWRITPVL